MEHFLMGKHIAALRRAKGLTQDELAERLGVSPQAVSKWENDLSCPDIMLLPRLAKIFGVTVDELLGATPPQNRCIGAGGRAQKSGRSDAAHRGQFRQGR